jgi:hypothetical protein
MEESTSTTGDEASLAIRPLIGSMLQSLGGLAYSVYATPWYLISSSTALGLDALWRLTSRRETPAARIERVSYQPIARVGSCGTVE